MPPAYFVDRHADFLREHEFFVRELHNHAARFDRDAIASRRRAFAEVRLSKPIARMHRNRTPVAGEARADVTRCTKPSIKRSEIGVVTQLFQILRRRCCCSVALSSARVGETGRQGGAQGGHVLGRVGKLGDQLDPGVDRDADGEVRRVTADGVGSVDIAAREIQKIARIEIEFQDRCRQVISDRRKGLAAVR